MEIVTERLLHVERKQKEKASIDLSREKAMVLKFKGRGPRCHYCKKMGYIQKNCFKRIEAEKRAEQHGSATSKGKKQDSKHKTAKNDVVGLIARHSVFCHR